MARKPETAVWLCIAATCVGFTLLPWYAIQDTSWYEALPQVFSRGEAANGLRQAALQGRIWLFFGVAGLVVCMPAALLPAGRTQGRCLLAGGLLGALGLAVSGFLIGARGWSVAAMRPHQQAPERLDTR